MTLFLFTFINNDYNHIFSSLSFSEEWRNQQKRERGWKMWIFREGEKSIETRFFHFRYTDHFNRFSLTFTSSSLYLSLRSKFRRKRFHFSKREILIFLFLFLSHTRKFFSRDKRKRDEKIRNEKEKILLESLAMKKIPWSSIFLPHSLLSSLSLTPSERKFFSPPRSISFCVLITSKQEEVPFFPSPSFSESRSSSL